MVIKPILATILVQGAAFAAPCSPVPSPELSAPRAVTSGPREHFLANYFGINARHWKMVRLADNAVKDIGDFFVPEVYRNVYCRCDLHPRWRGDGRQLAFNSVHEGSRQIYVMDAESDPEKESAHD